MLLLDYNQTKTICNGPKLIIKDYQRNIKVKSYKN